MLVGPMKKRIALAGVVGFLIMLFIAVVIGIVGYQFYAAKVAELEELKGSKREVYVINKDITFTNEVTMSDVEIRQIDMKSVPNGAITNATQLSTLFSNKAYARIDLQQGLVLTEEMIYKDEIMDQDVRIQEINMVLLPSQLDEGDYIDIRLLLPTGNDYVVISKARVTKITEKTMWLNLDEIERLRMSSAIIESYLTEGALLYAIEYADAPQQEAAQVTYDVLRSVMDLLRVSPNIANEIDRNNIIALDDNYDNRRALFDSYIAEYKVTNTDEEGNEIADRLNEKISEQIKIQQEERMTKLEAAAAQAAADAANQSGKIR